MPGRTNREKKATERSARLVSLRRQLPRSCGRKAARGGKVYGGASFGRLRIWMRPKDIRPHLMSRYTGDPFYFEHPLCGHSWPRIKGSVLYAKRPRQGDDTTHFLGCFLDNLDHGRTVVSAYYFCQPIS